MKKTFSSFNESDKDPFYSHNLRIEKGYKPRYKSGLIAVRFQDDETPYGKNKDVDEESGEFRINYQEVFNDKNNN